MYQGIVVVFIIACGLLVFSINHYINSWVFRSYFPGTSIRAIDFYFGFITATLDSLLSVLIVKQSTQQFIAFITGQHKTATFTVKNYQECLPFNPLGSKLAIEEMWGFIVCLLPACTTRVLLQKNMLYRIILKMLVWSPWVWSYVLYSASLIICGLGIVRANHLYFHLLKKCGHD